MFDDIDTKRWAVVEHIDLIGEVDATVWAATFVDTYNKNPAIASDAETMVGWFACAICAGEDRVRVGRPSWSEREELIRHLQAKNEQLQSSLEQLAGVDSDYE